MSAAKITRHLDEMGMGPEEVEYLLDAYRAEVLREAAQRIREELADRTRSLGGAFTLTTSYTAQHAADLIDPDKL